MTAQTPIRAHRDEHAPPALDCTRARAGKILDRLAPRVPVPHGFRDPGGFSDACRALARRDQLYRDIFPRIYAKEIGR